MHTKNYLTVVFYLSILAFPLISCNKPIPQETSRIAVFLPGEKDGKDHYALILEGIKNAAKKYQTKLEVIEGRHLVEQWPSALAQLAASRKYQLIISMEAAMGDISAQVSKSFPEQNILIFGGTGSGGEDVNEIIYDRLEQAFVMGYFAGLITSSKEMKKNINKELKVGLILEKQSAQIEKQVKPGFEIGLHTANPDIEMDYRILGNSPTEETIQGLTLDLIDQKVDVILVLAGEFSDLTLDTIAEYDAYGLWFDNDGSNSKRKKVLAESTINYQKIAADWMEAWFKNEIHKGKDIYIGNREDYMGFYLTSNRARRRVPAAINKNMQGLLKRIKDKSLDLQVLEN